MHTGIANQSPICNLGSKELENYSLTAGGATTHSNQMQYRFVHEFYIEAITEIAQPRPLL